MAGGNVRRKRTANFTIIGNKPMDDETLGAETLGVLCYVRSRPDDWAVHPMQLAKRFGCGRDRIYRILTELIEAGYVERSMQRLDGGQWGSVDYVFYDDPHDPRPENTEAVPCTENAEAEKPQAENTDTLLRTDLLPRTDTDQKTPVASKATKRATDAEIDAIFEERFWPIYPKRVGTRGKQEALKKFRTIVRAGGNVDKITIAAAKLAADWAPRISRKPADAQFIPMAATWLNKGRWDDEPDDREADGDGPPFRGGGGGETMFDLANHFENRVRETSYGQASPAHYHDGDSAAGADRLIDG